MCLGALAFEGVRVLEHGHRLDAPLAEAEARVRRDSPDASPSVRAMYRRTGLDPTKRRPSSEALVRRVLRGEPLPRINTVVDICNWCSLEFQLPYGLYDLDRIVGAIELRIGREREAYAGIRKDDVHVAGRLTLADEQGPFGNPSSDSARTMVTTSTTRVLMVVFAPAEVAPAEISRVVDESARRMCEFADATEVWRAII